MKEGDGHDLYPLTPPPPHARIRCIRGEGEGRGRGWKRERKREFRLFISKGETEKSFRFFQLFEPLSQTYHSSSWRIFFDKSKTRKGQYDLLFTLFPRSFHQSLYYHVLLHTLSPLPITDARTFHHILFASVPQPRSKHALHHHFTTPLAMTSRDPNLSLGRINCHLWCRWGQGRGQGEEE